MIRILSKSIVLFVLLAFLPATAVLSRGQYAAAMPEAVAASVLSGRSTMAAGQRMPASHGLKQYTAGGHVLGFREDGVVIASGSHALRLEFVNARPVSPIEEGTSSGHAEGKGLAPALGKIIYRDPWDGVTIVYENSGSGVAKSTYYVQAGADKASRSVAEIRLRYNVPVSIDENGDLVLSFANGVMRESRPVAWQEVSGTRIRVEAEYRLLGGREVGFRVGALDPRYPLVIDPALSWNTFMGGLTAGGFQYGLGISVDAEGNSYVVGWSDATWGSPRLPFAGTSDAFVAKLDAHGVLLWNTFLGSEGEDWGFRIAVDTSGNSYVVGWARGTFGSPIRPFTELPASGWEDAFVAKLDTDGFLQWNTFLGGAYHDRGSGIALDTSGNIYVSGHSDCDPEFEPWGSPILEPIGLTNAFVAKLETDGDLIWNTFIGGSTAGYGGTYGKGIAVDTNGNSYVTGQSLATWGSPIHDHTGSWTDVMVAKLDTNGTLKWNTFLGGWYHESGDGIAVDTNGNAYVTGISEGGWVSTLLPFTPSTSDAFVAKFDTNGALQWDTFLGGGHMDEGRGIALDTSGNPYVIGRSGVTWGVPVERFHGAGDIFVAKLNVDGGLQWNTFLGSYSHSDYGKAIALDANRSCYVTGFSMATWGTPISPYPGGYTNPFVAKISNFVTSPAGGEVWEVGSLHDITWTGFSGPVLIEYSVDNGLNWEWIGYEADSDGVYPWTVANDPSSRCRIRITDAEDYDPMDTSEGAFTITGFAVSSPNGGEQWVVGSPQTITWTTQGSFPTVRIWYSINNGSNWVPITTTANTGSFAWTLPSSVSSKYLVKVGGLSDDDPADTSDAVFSVLPVDGFLVVTPDGGEMWYSGWLQTITWQTSGTYTTVNVAYSIDNGSNWVPITTMTNTGSYDWTVPGVLSSQCLIMVSDSMDDAPSDTSDAVFSIGPVPDITVTSPSGGEVWRIGSTHNITWTSIAVSGTVTIELNDDEDGVWILGTADVSDGVFSWTISPDIPPGNDIYEILIRQGDVYDETLDEFTLFASGVLPYTETFANSAFPAGWTQQNPGLELWTVSPSNYAGGIAHEMCCGYTSASPAITRLVTSPVNTTGMSSVRLRFKHYLIGMDAGCVLKVQTSADGITWTDEAWSVPTRSSNIGPATVDTALTHNLGIDSTYVAFVISGDLSKFNYWYIDNVEITAPGKLRWFVKDVMGHYLWMNSMLPDESFEGWQPLQGGTSTAAATAVFNGRLHLIVKDAASDILWHQSMDSEGTWSGWTMLGGSSPSTPSMAVFNNKLYVAIQEVDNRISCKSMSSDGTWSAWTAFPGATSTTPVLAAFNGKLHLVVKDLVFNYMWYNSMDSTGTWSGWQQLSGASPSPVAMAEYNNRLYMFVRGSTNDLYYRSMDSSETWGGWTMMAGGTSIAPSLAAFNGKLYLVVKDANGYYVWMRSMDASETFGDWTRLQGGTSVPVAIVATYPVEEPTDIVGEWNVSYDFPGYGPETDPWRFLADGRTSIWDGEEWDDWRGTYAVNGNNMTTTVDLHEDTCTVVATIVDPNTMQGTIHDDYTGATTAWSATRVSLLKAKTTRAIR